MKLLLDQNISRRIVPRLSEYYPGSSQVALLGLDIAQDADIWRYARDHEFVIVTKDSDFAEMSMIQGSPPKVIWIRLGNVDNAAILHALQANKENIQRMIEREELDCLEICALASPPAT